jgi:hypothetical protein
LVLPAIEPSDALARAVDDPGLHWLHAARTEYSSVAAFARLSMELMAHGAPVDLVSRAHAAALDEVDHTHRCLLVARRLLEIDVELGPVRLVPPRLEVTLADLAVESFVHGCIGEALAAARASHAATEAREEIAAVLTAIADDELRHAALAWSIVAWCLRRDPALARDLAIALANWRREATVSPRAGAPEWGVLSSSTTRALARTVVDEIVEPTLHRVIGSTTLTSATSARL